MTATAPTTTTTQRQQQRRQITEFFTRLYGEDPPGWRVLFTLPARRAYWFLANDPEAAAAAVPPLVAARQNVYFGLALQDKETALDVARTRADVRARRTGEPPRRVSEQYTRGFAETAVALPGLWGDFDIAGAGHAKPGLPPDEAAVWGLVAEIGPQPTIAVNTGHGLHAYWQFRELWTFDTPQERQRAQVLSHRWQLTIGELARAHGWSFDLTHDIARVLRVPTTFNFKGHDNDDN